eukprot:CAMPEP_0204158742 /NCGR_PEP_ID=MMETSP0361-20130328/32377_1 /ASSEMBLY_ACC=CAM_ASM_000343 /TAXON_ID=268821 /ORGANISM="Scrippsiella Hangoei, Strain SHTV-5" /LENGTH=54 /DNA_ID=CAMNT_0051114731 /DNA_START=89 /DNA_END=253 /DNA_ORIENTATION=-
MATSTIATRFWLDSGIVLVGILRALWRSLVLFLVAFIGRSFSEVELNWQLASDH